MRVRELPDFRHASGTKRMQNTREQDWHMNHRVSLPPEPAISLTPDLLHHGHGGGFSVSEVVVIVSACFYNRQRGESRRVAGPAVGSPTFQAHVIGILRHIAVRTRTRRS
jgi:hypothetical protein